MTLYLSIYGMYMKKVNFSVLKESVAEKTGQGKARAAIKM